MKRIGLLLAVLTLTGGCVSPGTAPPKEAIEKLGRAYLVAMESPPLSVPPGLASAISGSGGSIDAARGVALFNTVLILLQLPDASKRAGEVSQTLQSALDGKGSWTPTLVLANEVQAQLVANGVASTVAPNVRPIPGVQNRGATFLMENWLAPIRAWYNDTKPSADYVSQPSDSSRYILEVGLLNYEIVMGSDLLVQVMIKVIDPSDGRVVGRARAANPWNTPKVAPIAQAFTDDAKRYKQIFAAEARILVKDCLAQLGIVK